MRADAQRNADKLREAAAELFCAQGLQVPLREIARHAGVSHGTLFNLFGSREQLIDAVAPDLATARIVELAERALANPDPWAGFVDYVHDLCAIQADEPMMADVLSGRYPDAEQIMDLCRSTAVTAGTIIARAQQSGDLRPDFTGEDLALTFGAVAQLAVSGRNSAPDAWRRSLFIVLDGLRTAAMHRSLDEVPLTSAQAECVLSALRADG